MSRAARARPEDGDEFPFDLPKVTAAERRRAVAILDALAERYPDAECELDYRTPHELLVATILSAQATDVSVNKATPALFARFPTPADYAAATPDAIEPYIRTIGLFRNKAKAIHAAMREVVERFGGEVPAAMDDLLTLRGVARKTANVVLGNAFGINAGFVVDTHIERLTQRFGLVPRGASVALIERRLMALVPRERWCLASHQIIFHGRRACKARCPGPLEAHKTGCHDDPICVKYGVACECREKAGPAPKAGKGATPAAVRLTRRGRAVE